MIAEEQKIADVLLARIEDSVAHSNPSALAVLAEAYQHLMAGARNRAESYYWATLATPIVIQPHLSAPPIQWPPVNPWYPWGQPEVTCEAKTSTGTKTECGT